MDATTVIDIVARVTDETSQGVSSAQRNISRLESSVQNLSKWLERTQNMSRLEIAASLRDAASKGIQNIVSKGKQLAGKVWTVTLKAKDLVTAPFKKVLGLLSNPVTQAAALAGISIGIGDTIKTFMDFEAAMSKVKAIAGTVQDDALPGLIQQAQQMGITFQTGANATETAMNILTKKAEQMGASTQFTSTEAANAFNYMAMAGWKAGDMMSGIDGILNLAAASGEDLATTSDIVTDAMTAFGLKADQANRFADVLAAAASNANTDVYKMGETFKYVAPVAGAMGYSIEDTAIAIGLIGNNGIKASQAGTTLRSIITRLATDAGASSKKLGALGTLTKKLGVEFYNADGSARAFNDVIVDARAAWQGLSAEQQTLYAKTIGGQEAMTGWLALMNSAPGDVDKVTGSIMDCSGAAENMAKTVNDNLSGSFKYLQSAVDDVKIAVGQKLSPYIRGLADWLTQNMPLIKSVVSEVVDSITGKINEVIESVKNLTSSPEWAKAETLWDKIKLVWDNIIVQPFNDWWNSSGKTWLAEKAHSIGEGLGSFLHDGLLTILGVDVESAVIDGYSIGASFFDGFFQGFKWQEITQALVQAIKDALSFLFTDGLKFFGINIGGSGSSGGSLPALPEGIESYSGSSGYSGYDGYSGYSGYDGYSGSQGNEEGASDTSWLSAALLAYGGHKILKPILKTGWHGAKTVRDIGKGVKLAREAAHGVAAAQAALAGEVGSGVRLGARIVQNGGKVASKAVPIVGGVVSLAEMGFDAVKGVQNAEKWTGSDSTEAKVASGIGSAFGGVGKGVFSEEESTGDKAMDLLGGATKGAGIGTAIRAFGGPAGMLIGAAIGTGIGALLSAIGGENISKALYDAGNTVGDFFSGSSSPTVGSSNITVGDSSPTVGTSNFTNGTSSPTAESSSLTFKKPDFDIDPQKALLDKVFSLGTALEKYNITGLTAQNAKFETKELQTALEDTAVSAYDFYNIFMTAVGKNLTDHFGDIKFSLEEIQESASAIVFDKQLDDITSFRSAAQKSQSTFQSLKSTIQQINVPELAIKSSLKSTLGLKLSEADVAGIKASVDSIITEAQSFLENKHLEAVMAVNLLVDSDNSQGFTANMDTLYANLQTQLNEATAELKSVVDKALEDGIISSEDKLKVNIGGVEYELDEAAAITELQNKITEITDKVNGAKEQAKLQTLKIRYGGAALDPESFDGLQQELKEQTQSLTQDYTAALEVSLTSLNLQLEEGVIDQKTFNSEVQKLTENYHAKIDELNVNVEKFQLDTVAEAYESELQHILPDLEGTTSEKLAQALHNAMDINPDPMEWTHEDIVKWFGLEDLNAESQTAIAALLRGIADSVSNTKLEATVTLDLKYKLKNTTPTLKVNNKNYPVEVTAMEKAAGGFVSGGPVLSWLAEEGYGEFVIPTNPSRRSRALDLYAQAGKALGIPNIEAHANGGFVGNLNGFASQRQSIELIPAFNSHNSSSYTTDEPPQPLFPQNSSSTQNNSNSSPVSVTIGNITLQVTVNGASNTDPEAILAVIREHLPELSDEIAGQIAEALQKVFANLPLTA